MYEFEGNIITLEYVRKIISAGVWGGLFSAVVASMLLAAIGIGKIHMN